MTLLKYVLVTKSLPDSPLLHTVTPQVVENANQNVFALLASDSSANNDSSGS